MDGRRAHGGDTGMTSLADGTRVSKDSVRVEAYGAVDELDCFLGMARVEASQTLPSGAAKDLIAVSLATMQEACWLIAGSLAGSGSSDGSISDVGRRIDDLTVRIEEMAGPINSFVVPGTSRVEASLHVARAVCRRAERRAAAMMTDNVSDESSEALPVLNRMSTLLFAASRLALGCSGMNVEYRRNAGLDNAKTR
ncbi:MAG TPA: cob(I)yrinic acid a,c-diamide adenosyltransferase [Myxococcota bacterium]|nr:cob(I)yrinic acid a,c-diamide adenosyltransferase [Myxococcota bacterium]